MQQGALSAEHLDEKAAFKQCWRYETWLWQWPLNRSTVLDYFKNSDFYDRSCNNEQIRMQQGVVETRLSQMTGVEYEVDGSQPRNENLFVIRKQYRESPNRTRLLALYYVVGSDPKLGQPGPQRGTVFPMPDMHSVLACSLQTGVYYAERALAALEEAARLRAEADAEEREERARTEEAAAAAAVASARVDGTGGAEDADTNMAGAGEEQAAAAVDPSQAALVDSVVRGFVSG